MSIERLRTSLADRYLIERELGQGGMATVYLAQDIKHDRKVALKVLKPELAAVIGADRFVVEIKTTAALQHPHILPLFDSGSARVVDHGSWVEGQQPTEGLGGGETHDSRPTTFLYYVMPYIDGETLRAKLDRETQLGVDEAVKLTVAVADALDYAHRHGVIHRDIKPENILLHDGRPIVADFGIALALSAAAGGRMTETGMSLGTPHYMSPEQATADKEISGRSDIYSLGSVLYEMLAGQPPHLGGSAQQIIMKIISEPVPPVTTYRKSVPPNVAAALSRALEKLAADRFGSAKEFAKALEDRGFTVAGMAAAAGVATQGRSSRLVPALSALAAGAMALAAWGWFRSSSTAVATPSWQNEIPLGEARFQGGAAIAPDGSFLVYSAALHGRLELWHRRSGAVEPIPITGTDGASMPSISPDGKRVAFITGDGRVMTVPVEGGRPTIVSAAPSNYWDKVDWADDDHILYTNYRGLVRFPASGGAPEQLSRVDSVAGEGLHSFPAALPDHRGAVFSIWPRGDFDLAAIRIGVVGPDGGKHTVLLAGIQAIWAPQGNLIVLHADGTFVRVPFDPATLRVTGPEVPLGLSAGRVTANSAIGVPTVATNGRMLWSASGAEDRADLVRVSRSGVVLGVDSSWPGLPTTISTAADGRRMAAVVISPGRDLWDVQVKEMRTGAMTLFSTPGVWDQAPTFSGDGRSLVFYGTSGEHDVIYRKVLGTAGPPEALIEGESGTLGWPTLSADGATLYFTRRGEVMARRLSAPGAPDRLVVAANGTAAAPVPSPDGKWLAYYADEGGRTEVYVRSTDPARAERWQVSTTGASVPPARWSGNGRELYYFARDSVIAAQVTSGPSFAITGQKALFSMTTYVARAFITPLPNGDFLLVRPRQTGAAFRLMMVDDWEGMGGTR